MSTNSSSHTRSPERGTAGKVSVSIEMAEKVPFDVAIDLNCNDVWMSQLWQDVSVSGAIKNYLMTVVCRCKANLSIEHRDTA
jgi:hypothetical protein